LKTVLLADDVDVLRAMLRDFLESLNVQVLEASSAAAAVRAARAHPGDIDVLLTDVELGRRSGWDCANEIARNRPGIRVIYMSAALTESEWHGHAERHSDSFFIQKPFRMEELKTILLAIFGMDERNAMGDRFSL